MGEVKAPLTPQPGQGVKVAVGGPGVGVQVAVAV